MALTVGSYAWPGHARPAAVATVVALTALSCFGVRRSALVTRALVAVVLVVLAGVVLAGLVGADASVNHVNGLTSHGPRAVLQAAGFLFFAFAGYARIATLGEEVRDPARTIPRAIPLALGITLAVYATLAIVVLAVLGPDRLAASPAPLAAVTAAGSWAWMEPVVRVGAVLAAVGSLLSLLLGVSRTTLAMARDRHLPATLAAVHPRHPAPRHAELAVGAVVVLVVLVADVGEAIGFSSFAVLAYYAIANASALTLGREAGRRVVPVLGVAGCLLVAASLPATATLTGVAVLATGAVLWLRGRHRRPPSRPPAELPREPAG
jgi:APA family basic amino acid/polyamine antiporter